MNKFIDHLKLQGRSKNTIKSYCQKVNSFVEYINNDYSQEKVNKYFLNLQEKCSNVTINCYRASIQSYVTFKNLDVKMPPLLKTITKIPDAITIEEFENEIISVVEEEFEEVEKVKAVFYLLMYSGLRPSELVSLKRKDFDLKNNQGIVLRRKNQLEDIFIFTSKVASLIKLYFLLEEEELNAFNLTIRGLQYCFEKIRGDCPNMRLRPYLFRHSSATRLLEEGFNLIEIQNFLGHKRSGSVEKYLRVNKAGFKQKYLDRIK